MEIGVIYLARGKDYGLYSVKKFLESYREYPAGCSHDFIIAAKGWEGKEKEFAKLKELAKMYNARIIELSDDAFDVGAYMEVAKQIDNKYLFFIGTSTTILEKDWLKSFYEKSLENPEIKLLGSSGSWESLEKSFLEVLDLPNNNIVNKIYSSCTDFFNRVVPSVGLKRALKMFREPVPFPNYFVRTNCFFMERELFIEYSKTIPKIRKICDANLIEHGTNSLTNFVLNKGYKVALLGKNDRLVYPRDWKDANVYCSPKQYDFLYFKDKRTEKYRLEEPAFQFYMEECTWGEAYKREQIPVEKDVSVIYLIRGKDWGIETAKKFFDSYRKYNAGYPHRLVIAAKAWEDNQEDYDTLKSLAEEVDATIINLPDDGFDFAAYYRVAKQLHTRYILCLVSTSEIMDDNWLLKFKNQFDKNERLKLLGTNASLSETPDIFIVIKNEVSKYSKKKKLYKFMKVVKFFQYLPFCLNAIIRPLCCPNFHIRTNAFMIDRKLYMKFIKKKGLPKAKTDAWDRESGYKSLTRFILKRKEQCGIVGKDGIFYDRDNCVNSRTFFCPDTSNVLIRDKYDEFYHNFPLLDQMIVEENVWGRYFPRWKEGEDTKFTVLIPTKNRLELLKYAINSVLAQNYTNWEVIVSDNFSEEDVKGYIESLNDERIKYIKPPAPCNVTANWNFVNEQASGEYIIMLGDDDALLPNFFERCNEEIRKNGHPDVLNFGAYVYCQPNVSPTAPKGFVFSALETCSQFVVNRETPSFLSKEHRKKLVEESLKFNFQFGFNMQYFLYNREIVLRIKKLGFFYEAPYPDYYTANMLMLLAENFLLIPENLVVIGITPKSYGYYYQNNREKEGMAFHDEEHYRKKAPRYLRRKLCNVAEMETAALATFAIIPKKLKRFRKLRKLKIDLKYYYQAVIKRIVKDCDPKDAWKIILREVFPKLALWDYREYYRFTQEQIAAKEVPQISNDITNSYENIEVLIKAIQDGNVKC